MIYLETIYKHEHVTTCMHSENYFKNKNINLHLALMNYKFGIKMLFLSLYTCLYRNMSQFYVEKVVEGY